MSMNDDRKLVTIREAHTGDLGWITWRHGELYAQEYGWNDQFEALVAETCAQFLRNHDAASERCWIAMLSERRVGSIMLVRRSADTAKLRLFLVEPETRGCGVGHALMDTFLTFAREIGYVRVILWTNSCLEAARALYQSYGFRLISSEPNEEFGPLTIAETWELQL